MIPELNRPVDDLSEEALAVAVLLRMYEERAARARADRDLLVSAGSTRGTPGHPPGSDTDKRTHLLGSSRLLESIPGSVSRGGLAEACAWVVLRQDMMVSLTQSEPLCLPLESLQRSRSFVDEDPQSLANRMVFLCGKILFHAFQPKSRPSGQDRVDGAGSDKWWDGIAAEVAAWYQTTPWHFQPTWVDEPRVESLGGSAFPTLRMAHLGYGTYCIAAGIPRLEAGSLGSGVKAKRRVSNSTTAVGYQHYHLAQLLLTIFDPRLCKAGFEIVLKRREADVSTKYTSTPPGQALPEHRETALLTSGPCIQTRPENGATPSPRAGWHLDQQPDNGQYHVHSLTYPASM